MRAGGREPTTWWTQDSQAKQYILALTGVHYRRVPSRCDRLVIAADGQVGILEGGGGGWIAAAEAPQPSSTGRI